MPTIMTILGCVLIGQVASDQPSATTLFAQPQQTTSTEDSHLSSDTIPPPVADTIPPASDDSIPQAALPENTPTAEQTNPSEIPQTLTPPRTTVTIGDNASAMTEQPASLRTRPPQLIADALTVPSGSAISGQPLQLVQALSATNDRRQQLALTFAYWKTVEAMAKYHFCQDQVNQLGRLQSRSGEEATLQSAQSAATAMLREAELSASSAQFELAALLQIPANAALPLPSDQPHVGAYRTNFQELFTARQPPDRARVIDRTLPIRRMAIDQRAIAIQAAQDALTAAIDNNRAGQGGLASVVANCSQLIRQQRAFIETVCHYNTDIAEYAMLVAAPGATPQILVGFMIKTSREPSNSSNIETDNGIRPTSLNEPVSPPATWSGTGQPTLAPKRAMSASAIPTIPPAQQWSSSVTPVKNEPTLAPPRDAAVIREKNEPTPAPPRGLTPIGAKNEPTLAPPRSELNKTKSDDMSIPDASKQEEPAKIRYNVGDPFSRRVEKVFKPVDDVSEVSTALYPALVDAPPAVRAKQLTLALHWDRSLPEGTGRAMTLEESLARQSGGDRRATVEAFWNARQRAAEYQVIAQEIEFLDNLAPVALQRRSQPTGAAEMLFLRSARQSAKANRLEAQTALIEAQFELAMRTQTVAESLWPLPSTAPHAGQYLLNLEAQPRTLVETWPMRRLAASIPAYSTSLQECATSVVASDTAREQSLGQYSAGNLPIEQTIEGVTHQTQQTFDFLQTLTDYNRSIAEYAIAVLPPNAQPTRVAAALVVSR